MRRDVPCDPAGGDGARFAGLPPVFSIEPAPGAAMSVLHTVAAFVLTLGVLIVIHELGHYWIARLCKVKVLRFSVGFGKPLWTREYGADRTEWAIAAFPLGGYV